MSSVNSSVNSNSLSEDSTRSNASSKEVVDRLKETIYQEADDFGNKLDHPMKDFILNRDTTEEPLKASIRGLTKCIGYLDLAGKRIMGISILEDLGVQPVARAAENLSTNEYRSNARQILKFLKERALEAFVSAFDPPTSSGDADAKRALLAMRTAIDFCDTLIDRVMFEGYNCIVEEEEQVKEEEEVEEVQQEESDGGEEEEEEEEDDGGEEEEEEEEDDED